MLRTGPNICWSESKARRLQEEMTEMQREAPGVSVSVGVSGCVSNGLRLTPPKLAILIHLILYL